MKNFFTMIVVLSFFLLTGCQTNSFTAEQSLKNFEKYTALIEDIGLQYGLIVVEDDEDLESGIKDLIIEISDTSRIMIRMMNGVDDLQKGRETFSIVYTVGENDAIDAGLFLELANIISGYELTQDFYDHFMQAPEEKYPSAKYGLEKTNDKEIFKLHAMNFFEDWMISYVKFLDSSEELSFGGLTNK